MVAKCAECRKGEHDNIDDNVTMCKVKDPSTGRVVKKYLCASHVDVLLTDGYEVS